MISPILSEEDISLDLVTKGKQSALSKIAIRIARRNGLDEQMVIRGLFDRECLGSTGIGRGVAIPHALLGMISSPAASLTRLAQPIDFDGPDDNPVDLIYTILWPASATSAFLPALSQYAGCFGHLRFGRDSDRHGHPMRRWRFSKLSRFRQFPPICILAASSLAFWCPGT
ncbi:PTS sugar transporter subunit IIA [Mesorhizobium sp.]|uniref:PTS sugar transporter subunit IIA n=1 Tax=Mesorhizobium sp. TaxID=1871066 RepID=UPI002580921C|nr:PTS sugar transporter subunit IIA [Mesorhizobium sp.]